MTIWKSLHYRLRANFDGYSSAYVANPPKELETDGKAVFDIRNVYSFLASLRHFGGYLTWRATIPENSISEETQQAFNDKSAWYVVPGENGRLKPGERQINFVWYYNCPGGSQEFTEIMTDVDRLQHRSTVPRGKIRAEVWAKQQAQSQSVLAAPVKEPVNKITDPFVTAISDYQAPQASFFGDHLLLVGDVFGFFRPHIAQSTNQAATDCMLLEKVLKGEMGFPKWEKQVMQYAHITRMRSNVIGTQKLSEYLVWLYHDIRYRVPVAAQRWGFII